MDLPKLYVIGDSISIAYGPLLERHLSGKVQYSRKAGEDEALLDLDNPQGANGGDSAMVRKFLQAKVGKDELKADVVLFNCGLHDIKVNLATLEKQIPLEDYRSNLIGIVDVIQQSGATPVWVRTTQVVDEIHNTRSRNFHRFSADAEAYNRISDEVMEQAGVSAIDLHGFTGTLDEPIFRDHVHFTEPVVAKQAAFLAGWICAFLQ